MITYLHSKLSILSIVVIAYLYYYLQQQRYSLRKTNVLPSLNNTFYYTTTSHNVRNLDPNEKYITFFTHSGFQNQLIQIENGLLLAWYLNRTLLLPHALLGQSFGWSTYPKLYLQHTIRDTNNNICNHKRTRSLFQKNNKLKCPDKQRYTMASFDELFDLSWARQHIRIESREYSDIHWLEHQYHIKRNKSIPEQNNGSYVDGDILFFKDYTRYDWRLFDIPRKNRFLGKYKDSMDMTELRQREEKLIHFTSLFGTGKFSLKSTEDRQFFKTLRQSITCKHPAVLKITEKVIQSLGGPGNFIGVHLRTADGLFTDVIPENIQHILKTVDTIGIKRGTNSLFPSNDQPVPLETCVSMAKSNQTDLIFMATDAIYPRDNPLFRDLWLHIPCIFTLNDLMDDNHHYWSHMDQYRTPHTGESMRKFLIPLVDALVASKGHSFIGTKGSTYSGYIRRLHDKE